MAAMPEMATMPEALDAAGEGEAAGGFLEHALQVRDAGKNGGELHEMQAGGLGRARKRHRAGVLGGDREVAKCHPQRLIAQPRVRQRAARAGEVGVEDHRRPAGIPAQVVVRTDRRRRGAAKVAHCRLG